MRNGKLKKVPDRKNTHAYIDTNIGKVMLLYCPDYKTYDMLKNSILFPDPINVSVEHMKKKIF